MVVFDSSNSMFQNIVSWLGHKGLKLSYVINIERLEFFADQSPPMWAYRVRLQGKYKQITLNMGASHESLNLSAPYVFTLNKTSVIKVLTYSYCSKSDVKHWFLTFYSIKGVLCVIRVTANLAQDWRFLSSAKSDVKQWLSF